MKKVKLSIIVPVYNVENYLKKCLDSLINQNSKEYEIIVVNDGSTDNSLNICKEYEKNEKIKIFTKKNGGLSSARNYGIDKAKGDYIAFVDSDDWVEDDYVLQIINVIDNNENCDLITYDLISINDGWKDGEIKKIYENFDSMNIHNFIQESLNPSFICARVYSKKLITKIGFPKENYWYEDMGTMPIILSNINQMQYIQKPIYYYRQRSSSITNAPMNIKTLGVIKAWENSMKNMDSKYIDDYIFALYRSIITFIYFKPEFANEFLDFYNKYKKTFDNNYLIKEKINKRELENLADKKIIPKKIHYFWFGNGKKSEIFDKCYESWKKYAPDFEIIEWNETNCNVNECQYVKEAYENKKYAFVTDYFRLKIISEHGGIYVDTDTEFTNYIHKLLLNRVFFAFETNNIHAGIFGAVPNSNIINKLLNLYKKDNFINADGTLNLEDTIPKRISNLLKAETNIKFNGKEQLLNDDIKIYSADVLTLNMYNSKNIAEHHYEASWWDIKYRVQSYKYNVLQYYFMFVDEHDDYYSISYHIRCILRKVIPLKLRKMIKNGIKNK